MDKKKEWDYYSLCKNMYTTDEYDPFFEQYEADADFARVIDDFCLSCPVLRQCYNTGKLKKLQGCWGGVYLDNGKPDPKRNAHKSKETWNEIRRRTNDPTL